MKFYHIVVIIMGESRCGQMGWFDRTDTVASQKTSKTAPALCYPSSIHPLNPKGRHHTYNAPSVKGVHGQR